MLFDESTAVL